ncbi:MAG TPA: hypothetical protein VFG72_06050 [Marmoricola sp.]|nr:hypothetical protein [Marmoricola sp.]
MEWLVLVLVGGGGAWGARRFKARRAVSRDRLEELDGVRRLADEDVTVFGEQLRRLDAQVGEHPLDEDGQVDYQRALDAYESAQRAVPGLRVADEVSTVTDTLATGRYALACVQARVAGVELPELRSPCFFNPQHGPSVADVLWTTSRYGTRTVPACAQDAARVAAHEKPELRTVAIGSRKVPYWEAGAAFQPYSRGYFAAAAAAQMRGVTVGWAFATPPSGDMGFIGTTEGPGAAGFGGEWGGIGDSGVGDFGGGGGGDGGGW